MILPSQSRVVHGPEPTAPSYQQHENHNRADWKIQKTHLALLKIQKRAAPAASKSNWPSTATGIHGGQRLTATPAGHERRAAPAVTSVAAIASPAAAPALVSVRDQSPYCSSAWARAGAGCCSLASGPTWALGGKNTGVPESLAAGKGADLEAWIWKGRAGQSLGACCMRPEIAGTSRRGWWLRRRDGGGEKVDREPGV
uniref:Uncharacterized protein n=1 Tax=Triticum urartu TaxID=4572 RepID=A0A8R7QN16_TRIUA